MKLTHDDIGGYQVLFLDEPPAWNQETNTVDGPPDILCGPDREAWAELICALVNVPQWRRLAAHLYPDKPELCELVARLEADDD